MMHALALALGAGGRVRPLAKWAAAKQAVIAGTRRARVAHIGDSTTAGQGAGTGGSGIIDARVGSYPARLASLLATAGIQSRIDSMAGSAGQTYAAYVTYDPRVTIGAGWVDIGDQSLGGRVFSNSADASVLSFAPAGQVDTFDIFHEVRSTGGSFVWNVDGGADSSAVSTAGTASIGKTTVSAGSLGTHTLNIKRSSGPVHISRVEAYNSASPAAEMLNMGWAGSATAQWNSTSQGWSTRNVLAAETFDLVIINLGINDWLGSVAVDTYKSNLQSIVSAAKSHSDVILLAPFPSAAGSKPVDQQALYIQAVKEVAAANGCPVLDLTQLFGSHAAAFANGYAFDNLHPSAAGYEVIADALADILLAA